MTQAARRRPPHESLSTIQIREIALAAMVDERTLRRGLRGDPLLAMTHERIRRELKRRHLEHLLPPEPQPPKAA